MPLADPRLIERAGTLRDNGSSRHTGKDARHSKSSRLRPLASDTYPIAYEIVADFCREARYSLRTPRTASETIGHRLRLKYESKAGKKPNSKYEPRKSTSDVRTTNCEPRKSTSGVRTWKNGRSVSRVEKSLIFVLSPSENRTVRQLRTNLGLSLNRSQ